MVKALAFAYVTEHHQYRQPEIYTVPHINKNTIGNRAFSQGAFRLPANVKDAPLFTVFESRPIPLA